MMPYTVQFAVSSIAVYRIPECRRPGHPSIVTSDRRPVSTWSPIRRNESRNPRGLLGPHPKHGFFPSFSRATPDSSAAMDSPVEPRSKFRLRVRRSSGSSISVRARKRVEGGDCEDYRDASQAADQGHGYRDNRAQRGHEVLPSDGPGLRGRHVLAEEPAFVRTIRPHRLPCERDENVMAKAKTPSLKAAVLAVSFAPRLSPFSMGRIRGHASGRFEGAAGRSDGV